MESYTSDVIDASRVDSGLNSRAPSDSTKVARGPGQQGELVVENSVVIYEKISSFLWDTTATD